MPRTVAPTLAVIAVALLVWQVFPSDEHDGQEGEAARRAARGGDAASGESVAGGAGTEGSRSAARQVGPGRDVGVRDGASGARIEAGVRDAGGVSDVDGRSDLRRSRVQAVSPAPGRSARADLASPPPEGDAADLSASESDAGSEPSLADLEAEAAAIAESLGLVAPADLARRIDTRVDPSLPPNELDQAREDARREVLADAAIVEDLVRSRYGEDASPRQVQEARDWGYTLISSQSEAYRAARLARVSNLLTP